MNQSAPAIPLGQLVATDPARAVPLLREALMRKGEDPRVLRLLGQALRKLGQDSQAELAENAAIRASVRDPELIAKAASGDTGSTMRAMAEERRVRLDPEARAERFVGAWKQMEQAHARLEQSGNQAGADRMRDTMVKAAGALERDPQLESALRRHAPDLELKMEKNRSIGETLAASILPERDRGLSR